MAYLAQVKDRPFLACVNALYLAVPAFAHPALHASFEREEYVVAFEFFVAEAQDDVFVHYGRAD